MKTILTFIRPSLDVEFFPLAKLEDRSMASDLAIIFYQAENGAVSEVDNKWSEDELTLTRTITWASKEKREEFESKITSKYPEFLQLRKQYCIDNGITFTSEEQE